MSGGACAARRSAGFRKESCDRMAAGISGGGAKWREEVRISSRCRRDRPHRRADAFSRRRRRAACRQHDHHIAPFLVRHMPATGQDLDRGWAAVALADADAAAAQFPVPSCARVDVEHAEAIAHHLRHSHWCWMSATSPRMPMAPCPIRRIASSTTSWRRPVTMTCAPSIANRCVDTAAANRHQRDLASRRFIDCLLLRAGVRRARPLRGEGAVAGCKGGSSIAASEDLRAGIGVAAFATIASARFPARRAACVRGNTVCPPRT